MRRFAIIGIAAAAMLVFAIAGGDAPPTDGRLGGAGVVSLQQQQGRWSLAIAGALPPGTSYHLRLELADGTVSTATGESRTWQFPDAWNEAVARHQRGTLRIEWDDGTGLVVRHSLQLP